MLELNETQLRIVQVRLEASELTYLPLKEELFDHLCCRIEERIASGHSFDAALEEAFAAFGERGLKETEEKTIHYIKQKTFNMKKVSLLTLSLLLLGSTLVWGLQHDPPSLVPIKGTYKITSSFGTRIHPILQEKRMHKGIDLAAPIGTAVHATADGEVVELGINQKGHGHYLIIKHDEEYQTLYAQLSADFFVEKGQKVKRGDLIALIGEPVLSTGPHLHYEVLKNGKVENPEHYFSL